MQNNDKHKRDELQKLFVNWLICLLDEHYGLNGWGTSEASSWSITLADGSTIQVGFKPSGQPDVHGPAKYKGTLASIVGEADRRTVARDYGAGAWWMVACRTDMWFSNSEVGMLHSLRLRNEYVPNQFQGDWRLGNDALVSFRQASPSMGHFPRFDVDIVFRVLGPGPGPFSQERAQERGPLLRAATGFATAAPLLRSPVFVPVNSDEWVCEITGKLVEASEFPVGTVEGPSLWLEVTRLPQSLAFPIAEHVQRAQGAMFAYEQSMRQESEYVTLVLLVSTLEALSLPNTSWRKEQVTSRFRRFMQELCPDAIRMVMEHEHFADAFGSYTSDRRFLEELYSSRSEPLHTGFLQHPISAPFVGRAPLRVMLVSGLVRAAIVEFLWRPFSSLIGNPEIRKESQQRTLAYVQPRRR